MNSHSTTASDTENAVRQNFRRSGIFIVMSFIVNAGLNIVLIAWLARRYGLDIVGLWAFLNLIVVYILVADFGLMNGLTRMVATEGVFKAVLYLRHLRRLIFMAMAAVAFGMALAVFSGGEKDTIISIGLAVIAGGFQLLANWALAIRMGQHEQFWFNISTILRVLLQSFLAIALPLWAQIPHAVSFGLALLAGGLSAHLFSLYLNRRYSGIESKDPSPRLDEIFSLTKGFGLLNVVQRLFLPLLQSTVYFLAGSAALGIFTIALRVPVVLSQSINEVLRILLPGLSQLQKEEDRKGILRLLRDGVLLQLLVMVPVCLGYLIISDKVFFAWIGEAPAELVYCSQILTLGMIAGSAFSPLYWGLQASGSANLVATASTISLLVAVIGGVSSFFVWGSIISIAVSMVAGQVILTLLVSIWSHQRTDTLIPPLIHIRWRRVFFCQLVVLSLIVLPTLTLPAEPFFMNLLLSALLTFSVGGIFLAYQWKAESFFQEF